MKFELKQHFYIESARSLTKLSSDHPCSQMHGHSFHIILTLVGEKNSVGWVIDYNEIKEKMSPILKRLDHQVLNTTIENPTSENLCEYIYTEAKKVLPQITRITILETPHTECSYPA